MTTYIHEVLLLRNLHDLGAADIPIVLCDLNQTELKQAMDYWVWLSKKGNHTSPERAKKCQSPIIYRMEFSSGLTK